MARARSGRLVGFGPREWQRLTLGFEACIAGLEGNHHQSAIAEASGWSSCAAEEGAVVVATVMVRTSYERMIGLRPFTAVHRMTAAVHRMAVVAGLRKIVVASAGMLVAWALQAVGTAGCSSPSADPEVLNWP